MRIPSVAAQRGGLRLNLTPLIDVIFNLIIFFLAAAHFARNEPVTDVDLPAATSRDVDSESPRRLTVTVATGPTFLIGTEEQPRDVIQAMIATQAKGNSDRPLELRIRADRAVPFGEVEPLLVAAAEAGVNDVKFAISPLEK
ncbi:MAG: biopolymer transporter ExbD [Planctomycetota bacterium]|nr:biopolymer transporter ExbD [Planctomycetaceae bacterium]MDQ3330151.1 biopolymer transporter ExbD [Planctomycetota bacterium]